MIFKSHQYFIPNGTIRTYQMLKLRHFTISWKILAYFDKKGGTVSTKMLEK